ncbi:LysM peptidoglycan-binding domain-containing protein [Moorella sulfitireducens]|uniref:LysM peptidoglycan-binding domain-containing protein n=1 Tax=Neomoorella sulfitireducens TaxID=2972948 RepID=UPI0021AD1212|nr:LysM domain-containing protein [Moorella sulfitireducens]
MVILLAIKFDEELDTESVPAASAFTVNIEGTVYTAGGIQLPGYQQNALSLTIPVPVLYGDDVTVSFNAGIGPGFSDLDGNELASFTIDSGINIRPGDTFFSIARRFGFTLEAILAANPGVDPNNLQVGQVICLPPSPGGRACPLPGRANLCSSAG